MNRTTVEADDGTMIDVTVRGTGPELVLLHGWTAGPADWQPAVERLSGHFRCNCWAARPHSGAADTDIERMARDLEALLVRMAPDGALLAGHSMGALTLLEYIRQYGTRRIRALTLIDQSPRLLTAPDWGRAQGGHFSEADRRRFLRGLNEDFVGTVLDLVAHSRLPESGGDGPGIDYTFLAARRRRLESLNPEAWIRAWESFIGKDYRDVLPRIDVPTLLVFGGRSRYYGPAVAAYMREHIADARVEVYENAGHGPHVEQPERFLGDMRQLAERAGWAEPE